MPSVSYYQAAKAWYEENRSGFSPRRRKVLRIWLKIMKREESKSGR